MKGLKVGSFIIKDYDLSNIYDCEESLLFLKKHEKKQTSGLFHFIQSNHYYIDSMLYDGWSKTLIFFQITMNEKHAIHYEELIDLISNSVGYQALTDKQKPYPIKYINFFSALKRGKLVKTFYFQWLTHKPLNEIEAKTKENHFQIKKKWNFFIETDCDDLWKKFEEQ